MTKLGLIILGALLCIAGIAFTATALATAASGAAIPENIPGIPAQLIGAFGALGVGICALIAAKEI